MAEELKKIFPARSYTLATGEEISVSPVKFKNLVKFGEALASVVSKVAEAGLAFEELGPGEVMKLLQVAYEETVKIMCIALDKPEDWVGELESTDALGLLTLIIEQNISEDAKKKIAGVFGSLTGVSVST